MINFFNNLLKPLEIVVAWIMVGFHAVLTRVGMPAAGGWTWALSIVGLVIVIRVLLIPLFVKQINASRGMQLLQPELKKIQEKYKGKSDPASRQALTTETMELYKRTGTNPLASCLPILLQSPIFFALFRVLNGIHSIALGKQSGVGALNRSLAVQADHATLFGAPLSDTFVHANTVSVRILTVVLIVLMSATTFTTQRQLMMKNMPSSALDNPFAQQQKILLYVLPLVFAVSGVNFPIGVLIYWLTTNLWSMGQQFYVIRRMPAPGSPAERALQERKMRRVGTVPEQSPGGGPTGPASGPQRPAGPAGPGDPGGAGGSGGLGGAVGGQRRQPKRQPKSKRPPPRQPGSGQDGVGTPPAPEPGSKVEDPLPVEGVKGRGGPSRRR